MLRDSVEGAEAVSGSRSHVVATPRPRGRPPAAPAVRRTRTITLRLSPAELTLLRKRAAAAGMKPITYLRASALSGGFIPSKKR